MPKLCLPPDCSAPDYSGLADVLLDATADIDEMTSDINYAGGTGALLGAWIAGTAVDDLRTNFAPCRRHRRRPDKVRSRAPLLTVCLGIGSLPPYSCSRPRRRNWPEPSSSLPW